MDDHKLWEKLYSKNNTQTEIALHSAGATVRHRNPFEHMEVPRNDEPLTQEFIKTWVIPFYMNFANADEEQKKNFAEASKKIDHSVITTLLGNFDWRTRQTAAWFIAINKDKTFEDTIGRMLLQSEVCYAGAAYCLALAAFGSANAENYLSEYLNYYLRQTHLYFDQADAFCALEHIDSETARQYLPLWEKFVADKPYFNLSSSKEHFHTQMKYIDEIRMMK